MARSTRSRPHRRVREAPAPRYASAPEPGLVGVLYDSDVIIEILRGRSRIAETAAALERSGVPTYHTAVACAEVFAGTRPGEQPATGAFFDARREIPLDGKVGTRAGAYLARYARSHGVEIADALVAAAATTAGLHLWTLNRKHFPMPELGFFDG